MAALETEPTPATLVTFDDDLYIDYRARRPDVGAPRRRQHPPRLVVASLLHGRDSNGRDVLLLTGPEPDMAWHRFARTVGELAERSASRSMAALGAYPFATPHTRPTRVSATSPSADLLAALPFRISSVDVPAGMAAALEQQLHGQRHPRRRDLGPGPHYVAAMSYPAASVALLDGLEQVTGIAVAGAELRREVDAAARAARPARRRQRRAPRDARPARTAVRRRRRSSEHAGEWPALEMRSGDELAAEVEHFLRDHQG